MLSRQCKPCARLRPGFSLVEVLLVLTLLVIIGGLVWTATDYPIVGQRLRRAADRVQAVWSKARVEAMTSGRIQLFRYAPNTGRFDVETRSGFGFYAGQNSQDAANEQATPLAAADSELANDENSLPQGIIFVASATEMDSRAAAVLEDESTGGAATQWSEPILFYPDGTTSNARLVLSTEEGRCVELSLRGLTGVATAGDPFNRGGARR